MNCYIKSIFLNFESFSGRLFLPDPLLLRRLWPDAIIGKQMKIWEAMNE